MRLEYKPMGDPEARECKIIRSSLLTLTFWENTLLGLSKYSVQFFQELNLCLIQKTDTIGIYNYFPVNFRAPAFPCIRLRTYLAGLPPSDNG